MINYLKSTIKEIVIVYGIGVIITFLSVIFFMINGYPLVNTATETLNIVTPPFYMNSIFLPYGMLIGEILWKWNEKKAWKCCIMLLIECITVAILSFTRYITNIPFSGHAIIIFFYLIHQLIYNKAKFPLRILIGIGVLVITGIYKLFLWNDPITFFLGAIVGIILWVPGYLFQLKKFKK